MILLMVHFDLESSPNCTKDSLKIYEGSISNSTLMATRCGNDTAQFISHSNLTNLVFNSDSTISGTGFSIHYGGISVTTVVNGLKLKFFISYCLFRE